MAKPLLPDELWQIIEPLLPRWAPSPKGGQPRLDDRKALTGILFVLKAGIPWEDLPIEMGCGCGMTCWRRLRDWQADGTWEKIHEVPLGRLRGASKLDMTLGIIDSSSTRAAHGGGETGPSPVDRAKPGTKHHIIVEGRGIPPATSITGANAPDVKELVPLFNPLPAIGGRVGHPVTKPVAMMGDRGSDSEPHRRGLEQMGVEPYLAERGTEDGSGLGIFGWAVERTLSWLRRNRRPRVRYERRPEIHQGFVTPACIKICASFLLNG